jgi:hypothetical protein
MAPGGELQLRGLPASECEAPSENVGAPTFKVLLEGYIEDIVAVLPPRLTGLRANFLKCRRLARNTGLK